MAIYKDIIQTLGDDIVDYNVGAWALFRDQMATEMNARYVFGDGRKLDESLLAYSIPDIQRSNRLVKGGKSTDFVYPRPNFTFYTNEGPKKILDTDPTLPEPSMETLHFYDDLHLKFNESTRTNDDGVKINGEYDEEGRIGDEKLDKGLGLDYYSGNIQTYSNGETLLSKTKRWFQNETNDYISKRFATTISRFHTDNSQVPIDELEHSVATQGFSKKYGLSHGRNLLKKDVTNSPDGYGYEDPYCRVWKWHKQYHKLVSDTMRPLKKSNSQLVKVDGWGWFRSSSESGFGNGAERLEKYGVMYDNDKKTNGLVNITPSTKGKVSVEHCMFSIENLAWKGTYANWDNNTEVNGLSREQKGPLGGRIMWFPPYDIKFNETSQANWQTNEFIGRGEPIYTYANTTRSGSLSFKLLIDHPAILDYWEGRYSPENNQSKSGVDDINSNEQTMLRFFAGCDILKAKRLEEKPKTTPSSNKNKKQKDEIESNNGEKYIQFFVFFPNNYSGKSDKIDTMAYLMNGVATNKYKVGDTVTDLEPVTNSFMTVNWEVVGGYEMREGTGISIVKEPTDGDKITNVNYGGREVELVKITGDELTPLNTNNKRKYYYRVDEDKDVVNQVFVGRENEGAVSYIDYNSYQLNSSNYTRAVSHFRIDDADSTYSFAEVFVALKGDYNGVFNGLYREKAVSTLESILSGGNGKIKEIICVGHASKQGNNASKSVNEKRNDILAEERGKSVKRWLSSHFHDSSIKFTSEGLPFDTQENSDPNDSNDEQAKLNRFAFVRIIYEGEETENAAETRSESSETYVFSGNTDSQAITGNEEPVENIPIVPEGSSVRYDNEATFFEKLTENAPIMTRLLSDRIKNFDPVFHSMSPEGFNARLTFLNQCMRQGPTISSSDTNTYNANNLSFGRPPVCVLRVGDFYNTKIVITSMTIDYDPLVWDLNQEGIGVMPMIANVTLNFNFIGGSDLGGPIQRLQNATSFNYYANASVYDNRSEEIEYGNGKYTKFKAFEPK